MGSYARFGSFVGLYKVHFFRVPWKIHLTPKFPQMQICGPFEEILVLDEFSDPSYSLKIPTLVTVCDENGYDL